MTGGKYTVGTASSYGVGCVTHNRISGQFLGKQTTVSIAGITVTAR
jgi:hypothetical protein